MCFNLGKMDMLAWLDLITAGFNLQVQKVLITISYPAYKTRMTSDQWSCTLQQFIHI